MRKIQKIIDATFCFFFGGGEGWWLVLCFAHPTIWWAFLLELSSEWFSAYKYGYTVVFFRYVDQFSAERKFTDIIQASGETDIHNSQRVQRHPQEAHQLVGIEPEEKTVSRQCLYRGNLCLFY